MAKRKHPLILSGRQLREMTEQTLTALMIANNPPVLFVRGGELVRVRWDEQQRPIVEGVSQDILSHRMGELADFGSPRAANRKMYKPLNPPLRVARDILSMGHWNFPPLQGTVEMPVVRKDGSILTEPGYDPQTGLYYVPTDFLVPEVPHHPTKQQVSDALALIEELICDFPFTFPADRANAIALLLTPVVRDVIDGPVPVALLDAPQQGTGKGLLAEVVALIATGHPAAMMAAPDSDDEWRKRITSTLYSGATVITIDNLERRLDAPPLASVLTSVTWRDRLLGQMRNLEIPNRATWLVTGNNIFLGGDLQRRCYWIRLDAKSPTPWIGRTFKHPELKAWVVEKRAQLIGALLTLARAWFAEGCPSTTGPVLGGFEPWSKIIGGILQNAGVTDFLSNLGDLYSIADDESEEWERFLRWLESKFGHNPFTVSQVNNDPELIDVVPEELLGLTGDFCTSREERLEDRKEPENAKEDVYARADCEQAAAD